MADYAEDFLNAVQILIDNSLSSVAYDKTITCQITDNSNREQGEYVVSDGSSEFKAYSENKKYNNKSYVYVTIPQGNYNNKKIIIGKYTKDNDKYYTYQAPLDTFANISGDLDNQDKTLLNNLSLIANDKDVQMKHVWTNSGSYSGYNRLGIKASFRSWLSNLNVKSGDYGLIIQIEGQSSKSGVNTILKNYNFGINNMYGNVYNFDTYYEQQAAYDVTNFDTINKIDIYFYQQYNFVNTSNQWIAVNDDYKIDNLFVKDIVVELGYDLSDFLSDEAIVYTDGLNSYSSEDSENDRKRTIKLNWIHKNTEDTIVAINNYNSVPNDFGRTKIHWFKYVLDDSVYSELGGKFWEELSDKENLFSFNIICDPSVQNDRYKVIIETTDNSTLTSYIGAMNSLTGNNKEEQLKVLTDNFNNTDLIQIEGTFTYTNTTDVTVYSALDLVQGITITATDVYGGIYRIYDEDNNIIDNSDNSTWRTLSASYSSVLTGEDEYDGDEQVTWRFPLVNTMITPPEQGIEYSTSDTIQYLDQNKEETTNVSEAYWIQITRDARSMAEYKDTEEVGESIINSVTQYYRISSYYTPQAINNIIYCYIIKNGRKYSNYIELTFGHSGTNGTQYTLSFKMKDGYTAFDLSNSDYQIPVELKLYDYDNLEVDDDNYHDVQISWLTSEDGLAFDSSNYYLYQKVENGNAVAINEQSHILKVQLIYNSVTLSAYLIIPISTNLQKYKYIQGAEKIIYDSTGANPKYYKDEYKLFDSAEVEQTDVSWSVLLPEKEEKAKQFYPSLLSNKIKPTSMYFKNIINNVCVIGKINNETVWIQPLYIDQNRFGNSVVNSWDGSLDIDEENGNILATMIGAGKKNSDNSFSGVLMGEVETNGETNIGLYGYSKGSNTFKFLEDGTATLGATGSGQIKIDGTSGVIQSGNYVKNSTGMKIDLDDGLIDAYSFKLTSSRVTIDSSGSGEYFKITGIDSNENVKTLMLVGDKEQYLQSMDYAPNSAGFKIDLADSQISAYGGFKLSVSSETDADGNSGFIKIDTSNAYPLQIGNDTTNFKVSYYGLMEANAGTIGGWTINSSSLRSNNGTLVLSASSGIYAGAIESSTNTLYSGKYLKDTDIGTTVGKYVKTSDVETSTETRDVDGTSVNITVYKLKSSVSTTREANSNYYCITAINDDELTFTKTYTYEAGSGISIGLTGDLIAGKGKFTDLSVENTIQGTCQRANYADYADTAEVANSLNKKLTCSIWPLGSGAIHGSIDTSSKTCTIDSIWLQHSHTISFA